MVESPSSRVTGRGRRDVLELSTPAGAVVFRGDAEVASCVGPRGLAHYQNYRVEKCTDITVSVCEEHTQVVSSCATREASNTVQEACPATLAKFGLQVAARQEEAKHGVGLCRWRLEWTRGVV